MSINLTHLQPAIRSLSQMKEVLFDKEWAQKAPADLELYYMYRDLAENKTDRRKIIQNSLRYDTTLLKPLMLGQEFNKTAGHDHPLVPGTNLTYPELYEVLKGQAIFLLQDSEGDKIKDIYAVKSQKGDKIIIPPCYEHLIINVGLKELKTANWVCRDFPENIYRPFQAKHGFGYWAVKKDGQLAWVKNTNYAVVPELRFAEPNDGLEKFGIIPDKKIYELIENLEKLEFLRTVL